MRVRRYEVRCGSGGAGSARVGDGMERDLEMLEDVTVSLITERRGSQPWGVAGGAPGASDENWLLPPARRPEPNPSPTTCSLRPSAGDVLRMLTPGGGGRGAGE